MPSKYIRGVKMTEYSLKKWKKPDHYIGKNWENHYVFLSITRDSDNIEKSNYIVALSKLLNVDYEPTKENDHSYIDNERYFRQFETDTIFTVRESHFLCGWIEWIAIHESNSKAIQAANKMIESISDYPILDDEFYSYLEMELENEFV